MPTIEEQSELRNNYIWIWTIQNGVNGYKVIGPNGNKIFLPATGCICEDSFIDLRSHGYYLSSSLESIRSHFASEVLFHSSSFGIGYKFRYYGRSVRPVFK